MKATQTNKMALRQMVYAAAWERYHDRCHTHESCNKQATNALRRFIASESTMTDETRKALGLC